MTESLVCIAKITSAHGIKGYVKVVSFTDVSSDIKQYSTLYDKSGKKEYRLKIVSMKGQTAIAAIEGVADRNEAETLRHTELYIPRDQLPDVEEGVFYWEDLKGLAVQLENGKHFGDVVEMHNFGAGDIIEIQLVNSKKTEMFSFDDQTIVNVDLDKRLVTLSLPEVVMAASAEKPKKNNSAANDD